MKVLGYFLTLFAGGVAGYFVAKKGLIEKVLASPRRSGIPKTEAERLATHKAKYGSVEMPVRGTGQSRIF